MRPPTQRTFATHGPRLVRAAALLLAGAAATTAPAGAAPTAEDDTPATPLRTWTATLHGQPLGTETVSERVEDGRWVLLSEGRVEATGVSFTQRLEVQRDSLAFERYRMDARTPGGAQVIEASRTGEGLRFHVVAGGQDLEATAAPSHTALCLDNLVFAHFEVLGRMAVRHAGEPFELTLAVPQVMKALAARVVSGETGRATSPGGETVEVREARLTVANLLTSVWYDSRTGEPWRVGVPAQGLEAMAEGWSPIDAPAAAAGAADGSGGEPPAPREREVTFESDLGEVPGTLALPAEGGGPFPGVVLLAGSGPQDRDVTLGPNAPFRDLASGLAAHGVATLRFDKRTWRWHREAAATGDAERQAELAARARTVTLREEYLADAVAAVRFLGRQPSIRDDAVFVAGHSLGALVAPEVAAEAGHVRGLVLLAAMGRPFETIVEEQLAFQQRLAGADPERAAAEAREATEPLRRARRGELAGGETFMGAGAAYYADLLSRDPAGTLAGSKLPVLLLHGGRDVQVRDADYEALRAALEARPGVPWHAVRFPELNHLLMPAEEGASGAEYAIPGHVDPAVPAAIAGWIAELD